jgi:hypothetical protein
MKGGCNMVSKSYEWIQKHRDKLQEKYDGKTIIVCEDKIVRVFDDAVDPITIYDEAIQICGGKDWSYTYVGGEEEYLL